MKSEIILTIGIPTYNGSEYISLAIESILREIPKEKEHYYEILISDNASTDNTKELVEKYQSTYPNLIRYICNSSNIGFDRNLDSLIKNSRGKFVKLLGDDDELMPKSISRITEVILQNPNLKIIAHSVKFVDILTNEYIESDHKVNETKIYKNGDEFFQESKWTTAAVSSLVVNKEEWIKANLDKYMDLKWIHLAGLIQILKINGISMGISDQLVIVRLNNDRWSTNFKTHLESHINRSKIMRSLFSSGYDLKTFLIFLSMEKEELNIHDIIKLRKQSLFENIKMAIMMIKHFWPFPIFCITLTTTLILGGGFINFARGLKNRIKK